MYNTIFDISDQGAGMQGISFVLGAGIFFLVPFCMLLLWIKYRYVFVSRDAVIFINHSPMLDIDQKSAEWHRALLRKGMSWVLGLIALIALAITALFALGSYKATQHYASLLNNNEAMVVEGPIEQFEPYPSSTEKIINKYESVSDRRYQKNESFRLNNVLFVYSRDYTDGGFQGSAEASVALSQARVAKVWYLDNPQAGIDKKIILRIDIK